MLEAAFFRLDWIPGHALHFPLNPFAVEIREVNARRSNYRQVTIGEKEKIASMVKNRRNIRSYEVFVLSKANYGRRSVASCNDLVRFIGADNHERENAGELFHSLTDRLFE